MFGANCVPKALKGGEEWHGVDILWSPISWCIQQSEHVSVLLVLFLDSSIQRGPVLVALVDISICLKKMQHRCMTTFHRATGPGNTRCT